MPEDTGADIITYLLSELSVEEKKAINQILLRVNEAISCLLTVGLEAAMNRHN